MNIHCGCTLCMHSVDICCRCTLWIYAVDVCCRCTLWMYAMNIRCGCTTWMCAMDAKFVVSDSQLNILETVVCEISTLVDGVKERYCFLLSSLMKGNRLQFILPGKAVRQNSCLRNRRHSFWLGVGYWGGSRSADTYRAFMFSLLLLARVYGIQHRERPAPLE